MFNWFKKKTKSSHPPKEETPSFASKIRKEQLVASTFTNANYPWLQPINILDTFTLPAKTQVRSLSMSHANDMIFVGCNQEFFILNWEDNRVSSLYHTQNISNQDIPCGAWSDEDEEIAICSFDGNVYIFNLISKSIVHTLFRKSAVYQVFWIEHGAALVVASTDPALQVYNTDNWNVRFKINMEGSTFGCGISADESLAVVASTSSEVRIVELQSGKAMASTKLPDRNYAPNHSVAFSCDNLIAVGSISSATIYLMDEKLHKISQIRPGTNIVRDLSFSADGDLLIAYVDNVGVQVFSVPKLELLQSYGNSDYTQDWPIFSPDGSLYMTAVRGEKLVTVLQSPFVWKERKQVLGLLLLLRELVPESVFFKDYLPLDLFRIILKLSTLLRR